MKNANLLLKGMTDIGRQVDALLAMKNISAIDRQALLTYLGGNEALFSVLPPEKRHVLGHGKSSLIVDCKFHGLPCNDHFTLLLSPQFLNCYTFTGFERKTYSVGVQNGVSTIFKEDEILWNTGHYSDQAYIQSTKGLRITIHEPHTIPNLFDNAIELIPGYSTTISIQQKNMERISTPKSKCMSTAWSEEKLHSNPVFRSTTYSCLFQCAIQYIWDRCGCRPTIQLEFKSDHYPFKAKANDLLCAFTNESDTLSLQKMFLKKQCEIKGMQELNDIKEAEIHPPCVEQYDWDCQSIEYSSDISHSQWPLDVEVHSFLYKYVSAKSNQINDYYKILKDKYNGSFNQDYNQQSTLTYNEVAQIMRKTFHPTANMTEIVNELKTKSRNKTMIPSINPRHLNLNSIEEAEIKWVHDSFYRLNIFFKESVVQVHKQVLEYGPADFWSSLGGILGLWAGISIITVIELLEFLGHLLKVFYVMACGRMGTDSSCFGRKQNRVLEIQTS